MSAVQQTIGAVPLTRTQLIERSRSVAQDVRDGLYEIRADAERRWHVHVHRDDQVDVWLISWTTDQGTQLHDHGGSAGAFTVVSGAINEAVWSSHDGGLRENTRVAGETVAFGDDYVHDVGNLYAETAVSVHAYSPPLSLMNFYDTEGDRLVKLASVWTDDPEEPAPILVVSS